MHVSSSKLKKHKKTNTKSPLSTCGCQCTFPSEKEDPNVEGGHDDQEGPDDDVEEEPGRAVEGAS